MHHAVAMRRRQARRKLGGNHADLGFGHRALLQPIRKSLAFQKLHGDEIEITDFSRCGVDLENLADVGMRDLARIAHFGGQPVIVARFGALDGDAAIELLVPRLVHDAHAALRDFADDAKSPFDEIAGLKRMLLYRVLTAEPFRAALRYGSSGVVRLIWERHRSDQLSLADRCDGACIKLKLGRFIMRIGDDMGQMRHIKALFVAGFGPIVWLAQAAGCRSQKRRDLRQHHSAEPTYRLELCEFHSAFAFLLVTLASVTTHPAKPPRRSLAARNAPPPIPAMRPQIDLSRAYFTLGDIDAQSEPDAYRTTARRISSLIRS